MGDGCCVSRVQNELKIIKSWQERCVVKYHVLAGTVTHTSNSCTTVQGPGGSGLMARMMLPAVLANFKTASALAFYFLGTLF